VRKTLQRLPWLELSILLVATLLRVWAIELKPPHFDEGVNGWFSDRMRETGYYAYDPTNYHGPLHFYLVFAGQMLFGRELWALRMPAIIASIGCVWIMFRFSRFFGKNTVAWAAAAMAVSPAYVFFGRYSIHESGMVFFLMMTVWGVLELWRSGSKLGLFAVVAGLSGMILTKETVVIHVGCLVLAAGALWLWDRVIPSMPAMPIARRRWEPRDAAIAAAIGIACILTFYSGFFHDWSLVRGIATTVSAWFATGVVDGGHAKEAYDFGPLNFYWVALMARYEWPALAGLAMCFRLIWPSPAQLRYLAIYAAGALLAYSIITYKTPWCIIVMLWPFLILLGAGVEELRRWRPAFTFVAPIAAGAAIAVSLLPCLWLNFRSHSDPKELYVYVQTFPEIRAFTDPLLKAAQKDPRNYEMIGQLMLDSYYPLPWMLGDFTRVGYYKEDNWPDRLDGTFIAAEESKAERVEALLQGIYIRVPFRLRDGQEDCVAWLRVDEFEGLAEGEVVDYGTLPR